MDLIDAVSRRRMVRRFDPDRDVPAETVAQLVALAQRAPSAGHTQGWDVLALSDPADRARFWEVSREIDGEPSAWLRGVSAAPVLLIMLADPTAYLDRYAEPDKGWTDRSLDRWPIPYWDTDTAMAAMILLLGAVDAGLGALFFGVPAARHEAVKAAYAVPSGRRIVGVIALGHEAQRVTSPSLRRGRRPLREVLHHGRFGASGAAPSEA
ncbi:nitroreductase family protein [Knoellia subterranea]|uniref:Nitroreductase n=1 Tax=Knoellia subterranea KCTC 19937 TaxID=1385521 RepID=A0A0A0JP69_9MICO|nr:nitroreductase family protein [Knoellia subterranea]KGN38514.1 nitroreductase [Knoellia subterranea KCTC 19937]